MTPSRRTHPIARTIYVKSGWTWQATGLAAVCVVAGLILERIHP